MPVAQFEIMAAADNRVSCCTNHGYVLSLDPKTGAQQWRYDTMPRRQARAGPRRRQAAAGAVGRADLELAGHR